jgi:transcription elongation factor Elf1
MAAGIIQPALYAKYRDPRDILREMFDGYVQGFIDRAYELPCTCPSCCHESMEATNVWREEKSVKGVWQCSVCGKKGSREVPLTDLVEDFNAELHKKKH